jgi:hypothetical protein
MVINNIYHFIFSFICFIAVCEASNQNSKKDAVMMGLLYDWIKSADIVVLVDNSRITPLETSNDNSIHYTVAITHVFKGNVFINDTIEYIILKKGKDTEELVDKNEYFLVAQAAGKDNKGEFHDIYAPVKRFNAIIISKDIRSKVVELIHEYTNICGIPSDSAQPALRKLIILLLQSNIPMLQIDGSKLILHINSWEQTQWAILKDFAIGTKTRHSLQGRALDNLIVEIVTKDPFEDVIVFIANQILAGNTEVVHYCRNPI